MTPLEFEQRYHDIQVPYRDADGRRQTVTVDVHVYRQTGRGVVIAERDKLLREFDREVRDSNGLRSIEFDPAHRRVISRAFNGKGSPETCRAILSYVLRYGIATPADLQNYCDFVGRVGLDCSGFVNSYFKAEGTIDRDWMIAQYGQGRQLRDTIGQVQPRDVLVWTNRAGVVLERPTAHIAIVASAPDSSGRGVVVESASSLGGLGHSTYTFTRVGTHRFQVRRPSGLSFVRAVGVNPPRRAGRRAAA